MSTSSSSEVTQREATEPAVAERARRRLQRGSTVGRFVVVDTLGHGAMGTVYAAWDPSLDRKVAVKLLHARTGAPGQRHEARARLLREAHAMARISHPNVVAVFDVGETEDDAVFVAMEVVEGGTVQDWLRSRPRPWREVLRLFCAAGDGLEAAHRAGVIHRDFKLENVLVGADGRPRVTDFGLARATDDGLAASAPSAEMADEIGVPAPRPSGPLDLPLTQSGAVMGTPGYMAPEQYGEGDVDARADVFAFCASLYRALYGERAFPGETMQEIAMATLHGRIREPRRGAKVPGWLRRILLRGLQVDRERRPASMRELLVALRDTPERRQRRGAAAVGLGGALLLLAWLSHEPPRPEAPTPCPSAVAGLDGVWDASRKAGVSRAFAATGKVHAMQQWSSVARILDAYAARWVAASDDACKACRVRGEQSAQMLELRRACLEDRRQDLRALVDVLDAVDSVGLDKAVGAAEGLPDLASCADTDRLSAAARPPDDPIMRQEIAALQRELATARAQRAAGQSSQALDRLRSIAQRVERTQFPPLVVEWAYRLGRLEETVDEKLAEAHLRRAVTVSEAAKLDESKASAEITLGDFEGSQRGHSTEAHAWFELARATLTRAGGDAQLVAYCDLQEAWTYAYEQIPAQAGRLFERVIESEGFASMPLDDRASAYSGLADVATNEGRPEEAVANGLLAEQAVEADLGPQHPYLAGYLNNLALDQLAAGHGADAVATAQRALALLEEQLRRGDIAATSPDLGLALHTLGEVLSGAGRPAEAVIALRRARSIYVGAHGDANADVAYADNDLAEALRALGRPAEARRALDEAGAVEKASSDVPDAVVACTLAGRAQLELDAGRRGAGLALAERAAERIKDGHASATTRDTVDRALARARARAREGGSARP